MRTNDANAIMGNVEILSKVRILLGSVNIEAKNAAEMVAVENGIATVMEGLTKIAEGLKADPCEDCKCEAAE